MNKGRSSQETYQAFDWESAYCALMEFEGWVRRRPCPVEGLQGAFIVLFGEVSNPV